MRKLGTVLLISSVLMSTPLLTSSPVKAAETSVSELNFTAPYKEKDVFLSKKVDSEVNSKTYLSMEDLDNVTPDQLVVIYREMKFDIENGIYTEEQLNQIAADKIRSLPSTITTMGYGWDSLTDDEKAIALADRKSVV